MTKTMLKAGLAILLAGAVTATPYQLFAQATNKAAGEQKEASHKQLSGPFHGKLASMDKTAKTITVGKRTFHITSESKLLKAGKPATLDDAVVGEEISGGFRTEEGKMVATKVNIGPKATEPKGGAKKEKTEKQ
jgi:hypothetical protein